ncbi:S-adenosylmethionine decarboxylase [Candidatus Acidianus copahuensis]|uniref:S-adenosylmethionine decarboxylase proenzyme n=2 Tax=Sulfolobaceae TaxID=118883 RepID=A0A031LU65_9CREN|nr:S-adenosylmethionine decarboxylase [Candidatus Acidianus copahuensis]NON62594.1 adenosylmethionine decarboxylase [Acidianus sp. RZ1]
MGVNQVFPKVVGRQVYGSLYDCDNNALKDLEYLRGVVTEAAKEGNMTLLDVKSWKIGEGVSIVAIVLESHITIHTWPEYSFATVDVYSCGSHTDPRKAFNYIASQLKAKKYTVNEADRSSEF